MQTGTGFGHDPAPNVLAYYVHHVGFPSSQCMFFLWPNKPEHTSPLLLPCTCIGTQAQQTPDAGLLPIPDFNLENVFPRPRPGQRCESRHASSSAPGRVRALLLGPSGVSSSLGCVDPQLSLICASQREQGSSEGLSLAHACPPPPP